MISIPIIKIENKILQSKARETVKVGEYMLNMYKGFEFSS